MIGNPAERKVIENNPRTRRHLFISLFTQGFIGFLANLKYRSARITSMPTSSSPTSQKTPSLGSRRRRRIILAALLLFIAAFTVFGFVVWSASSEVLSSSRGRISERLQHWIDHPDAHGIEIRPFQVHSPARSESCVALMVQPLPDGRVGERGQRLRNQLTARGIAYPSAGNVIGEVVLFHGRRGCKEHSLPVAEQFCAVGFRCILLDLPGCGERLSESPTFACGASDATFAQVALRSARVAFQLSEDTPASLWGISLGGAYVARSAGQPDAAWAALISVSSYPSLNTVLTRQAQQRFGLAGGLISTSVTQLCQWRGAVNLQASKPGEWAKEAKAPALIVHGAHDELISIKSGTQLFAAYGSAEKKWLEVPDARHGDVLYTPFPLYAPMAEWLLTHSFKTVGADQRRPKL